MTTSLYVDGLRGLSKIGPIQIRPITILVGKNSSGKSSFARIFPLLRQSVERQTKGPLLWFGDYVDFGSFEDALQESSQDGTITFGFSLKIPGKRSRKSAIPANSVIDSYRDFIQHRGPVPISYKFVLEKSKTDQSAHIERIIIEAFGHTAEIVLGRSMLVRKVEIDGRSVLGPKDYLMVRQPDSVVPGLEFLEEDKIKTDEDEETHILRFATDKHIFRRLSDRIGNLVHGRTSRETIDWIAQQLPLSYLDFVPRLWALNEQAPRTWTDYIERQYETPSRLKGLHTELFFARLPQLLDLVRTELELFLAQVRYIQPVRARAERYYRSQDLNVEEIDSQGRNMPMFLANLTEREIRDLSEWLERSMGFSVEITRTGGHVSILAKDDETKQSRNIADMGFGYSQVLPLAVQLWDLSQKKKNRPSHARATKSRQNNLVVIEQPELHLHPSLQAKLARLFISYIGTKETPKNAGPIIVETHSKEIVSELGAAIEEGEIAREDVAVYLFERQDDGKTSVRQSEFTSEGALKNWPIGFFSA